MRARSTNDSVVGFAPTNSLPVRAENDFWTSIMGAAAPF
jgi:hypothetical protein